MVVTRTKSRNKARDVVMISRGRGQDNSTEILSVKPIPTKKQMALRPVHPVLLVKKQHIEQPMDIKKHFILDTKELEALSRRKDRSYRGDASMHKLDAPITYVFSPLRLRLKGKRRRARRVTHWSPGPLLTSKSSRHISGLATKEVKHMLRLHIPTLPTGSDRSRVENLQYLNWEINLRFPLDSLKPSNLHHANGGPRLTDVAQIESNDPGAEPETPLHQDVGEDLETERLRIRNRLRLGSFQILANWTPIQGVEPLESVGVREGTVDSSPPDHKVPPSSGGDLKSMMIEEMLRSKAGGMYLGIRRTEALLDISPPLAQHQLRQPQPELLNGRESVHPAEISRSNRSLHDGSISTESPQADLVSDSDSISSVHTESPGPPPYEETTIKFTPAEHIGINIRHDWEMVVVMEPSPFNWTYLKPHNLPFRQRSRHLKPFPSNSSTPILDINSSGAAARFMSLRAKDMRNNQEYGADRMIGRLFADLISSELIPARCLLRKNTLPAWRTSFEPVTLDVGCVPTQGALAWDERVAPLLLAAQFSENMSGHDQKASQQLASGFHPTLIVLILYYLDARSGMGAKGGRLPSWMVVYGIIYTTSGFSIHEHYPVFRPSENGSGGWWGAASSWAVQFEDVFHRPSPNRSQSMAALLRICGHTQFVLKNLVNWDGYERLPLRPVRFLDCISWLRSRPVCTALGA